MLSTFSTTCISNTNMEVQLMSGVGKKSIGGQQDFFYISGQKIVDYTIITNLMH